MATEGGAAGGAAAEGVTDTLITSPIPYPELNKLREKFSEFKRDPTSPLPIFEVFPPEKVAGGVSPADITRVNQLYQDLLHDLYIAGETETYIIVKILSSNMSYNYENIKVYLRNKYKSYTEGERALLLGLFCKIYALHENIVAMSMEWPPYNYPVDGPLLVDVHGYKKETIHEADIRVLIELMNMTHDYKEGTGKSLNDFRKDFQAITNDLGQTVDYEKIFNKKFLDKTTGNKEFDSVNTLKNLYKESQFDSKSTKIFVEGQSSFQRLFGGVFLNKYFPSLFDIHLTLLNSSSFGENGQTGFVGGQIPTFLIRDIANNYLNRNQMYFCFIPRCADISAGVQEILNFPALMALDVTSGDQIPWIQFNYSFPKSMLCNRFEDNMFKLLGNFQGRRAETLPHPDLLIGISRGIVDANPLIETLWPEWFDSIQRGKWLDAVLYRWRTDINAMPYESLYEKTMKDAQEMFYSYAKNNITPSFEGEKQFLNVVRPAKETKEIILHSLGPNMKPVVSLISEKLAQLNKNANTNVNAAYNRFNQRVRPLLQGSAAASVKARNRGFFTGESKNSYRRTLKGKLYNLMRNAGARFTTEDAIAELQYIFDLSHNRTVSDRVVYERMKDWVTRYVTNKTSPRDHSLDGIANLFINVTPTMSRADLQHVIAEAIRMAHPNNLPSRKEDMTKSLRRVLFNPKKLTRGANLYKELDRLRTTYRNVVEQNSSVATELTKVVPPPKRGFFSRTFGGRNMDYNSAIQKAAQNVLRSLEQEPKISQNTGGAAAFPSAIGKMGPPVSAPSILPATQGQPVTVKQAIVRYRKPKVGQGGVAADMEDTYNLLTLTGSIARKTGINPSNYEGVKKLNGKNRTGHVTDEQLAQLGGRRKTARHSRMGRRHRHQKTRKQRGGAATSMPLAWYQQGAQFQGTVADPTGVGLAGSNAAWARSALPAQGGGRRRSRRGHSQQMGGFYPSIMGAGFASAGMRLLPAAAYMGYNQMESYKKQKTHRRSRK